MAYASLDDVVRHYNDDVVTTTQPDVDALADSVDVMIRAYITGRVAGDVIASWTTPTNTPELISDIAGKLIAAFRLRAMQATSTGVIPQLAQRLYDEAMEMLLGVAGGTIDVEGIELISTTSYTDEDYAPTGALVQAPKFTMAMDFG